MTYLQLEIGNSTTRTIIQNMTKAEHILLQNPSFISYGIWSPANLNAQFQVNLDAQKFLSRAYGLMLDPTARSDLINVTQNMHLNLPSEATISTRSPGPSRMLSGSHTIADLRYPRPQ